MANKWQSQDFNKVSKFGSSVHAFNHCTKSLLYSHIHKNVYNYVWVCKYMCMYKYMYVSLYTYAYILYKRVKSM